jgi:hypothetical protein
MNARQKGREDSILAQLPTAVLGLLIILLVVLIALVGVTMVHNRIPVEERESHTVPLGLINAGLTAMFGVIIGFTAYLVMGEYMDAQRTVQTEAADLEQIYRLSAPLPEPKQEQIQGLAASYARAVIEEEWPLMKQVRTSPHAGALAEELRGSIQEGYRTSTGTEQEILGKELDVMDELDEDRAERLIAMRQRLPSILWAALVVLAIAIIGLSLFVGMKSHRVHMLSVGALAVGITLVLFMVGVLDRPFGTDFGLRPQPFELVLNDIGGTQGR